MIHKLCDAKIRNPKPGEYHDGGGLFLDVKKTGRASWKQRYTFGGKRLKDGLGPYPQITLAQARIRSRSIMSDVANGIEPRAKNVVERVETFAQATALLYDLKKDALKGGGEAGRWMSTMTNHVLPKIGERDIASLTLDDLVEVIQPIWDRDIGRKAFNKITQVIHNARPRDTRVLAGVDDLEKQLKSQLRQIKRTNVKHPALDWRQIPDLWDSLGDDVDSLGFKFYLLNVPRVANVTGATWCQISKNELGFDVWDLPPDMHKSGDVMGSFSAPLSRQSLMILEKAENLEGRPELIFPQPKSYKKGMISENRWNNMLTDGGWMATCGRSAVPHGLRATFGTWCGDEEICDEKMAERCIQHKVESPKAEAYLRSRLYSKRLKVMQQWADFVTSGEVLRNRADAYLEDRQTFDPANGRSPAEIDDWLLPDRNDLLDEQANRQFEGAEIKRMYAP